MFWRALRLATTLVRQQQGQPSIFVQQLFDFNLCNILSVYSLHEKLRHSLLLLLNLFQHFLFIQLLLVNLLSGLSLWLLKDRNQMWQFFLFPSFNVLFNIFLQVFLNCCTEVLRANPRRIWNLLAISMSVVVIELEFKVFLLCTLSLRYRVWLPLTVLLSRCSFDWIVLTVPYATAEINIVAVILLRKRLK